MTMRFRSLLMAGLLGCAGSVCLADDGPIQEDGKVSVPAFEMPMSDFASEAAGPYWHKITSTPGLALSEPIEKLRSFYDAMNTKRAELMRTMYDVDVRKETVAGVPVMIVEPAGGVTEGNRDKLLINLHGGAFMWGAGSGELVEAIPIAALSGYRVMTVDYRMAPEHVFPAGSQDVYAVYTEMLKQYDATHIGIYGCSAGGALTAQATAWIIDKGAPAPGAIGTFCGTGVDYGGDSVQLDPIYAGGTPVSETGVPLTMMRLPYFSSVNEKGPLLVPGEYPDMLAKFPPTLLLAGGRDFAASGLTVMHRRLAAAGVPSKLYLFDGFWHAFFMDAEIPESQEAYDLIVAFFKEHLARE
ncbi:alpha/beta hydrolase [Kordiimonas gwangyangensis]|uniref:alpha/beta hydrolase n=2 Tax=Kordiimonas gwangyangensis TaxID=288022 RepID=UPI000475A56B|nr:alpha/beta hydrolase [Kordiimonas gwangyangensis]